MSGTSPSSHRAELAVAALSFGLACCLSYALQRLWDARTDPPLGTVLLQATIPYYWRIAAATLHGAGVAALVLVALRSTGSVQERAERWLARAPWLVPLVVLPCVLAMLAVP